MKVLITGFEPFGGETVNPSWEAVRRLPDTVDGGSLIKLPLPVEFGVCGEVLKKAMEEYSPQIVLSVGQAGGRPGITPERVAINIRDASAPDNSGAQPVDEPVVPGGPAAYFSTLPVKKIVAAIRAEGIPSYVSNSAGTYVCNDVMYMLLHRIGTAYPGVRGGFIHVPYIPEQVTDKKPGTPCVELALITRALELAIRVSLEEAGK